MGTRTETHAERLPYWNNTCIHWISSTLLLIQAVFRYGSLAMHTAISREPFRQHLKSKDVKFLVPVTIFIIIINNNNTTSVHGSPTGECGLLPEHNDYQVKCRCNYNTLIFYTFGNLVLRVIIITIIIITNIRYIVKVLDLDLGLQLWLG